VFKHLVLAATLSAPCVAFASQGMSLDERLAAVSTVESDLVMAPMQDSGGTGNPHEADAKRNVDEIDVHSAAPHPAHPRGTDNGNTHTRKSHGHAPWQSLLPGVMK
jgi:hypothetical protein